MSLQNRTTAFRITLGLNDQNGLRLTDDERDQAVRMVADRFDAFTLTEARGYWRGNPEDVYQFEILSSLGTDVGEKVYRLAEVLAIEFSQEAVMVTRQSGDAILVTQDGTHDYV